MRTRGGHGVARVGGPSVATRYTHEFVSRNLPDGTQAILEIGCGAGQLAAALMSSGSRVLALDTNETCVEASRSLGVDAHIARWPIDLDERFDAVLFTRSLHHISPLNRSIEAAVGALRPGGRLIVEDFRIETVSVRTDAWFTGLMQMLHAGGMLTGKSGLAGILEKLDFGEHRDELHSSTEIRQALSTHGTIEEEDAAYYFRYAQEDIDEGLAAVLLDYELSMIEAKAIDALGKRFVLTPHS